MGFLVGERVRDVLTLLLSQVGVNPMPKQRFWPVSVRSGIFFESGLDLRAIYLYVGPLVSKPTHLKGGFYALFA